MLPAMRAARWLLLSPLLPWLRSPAYAQPPPVPATPGAPAPVAVAAEVRPVPPRGIALPEADRRALEAELSTLAQELKRLRERPELAPLLPDVEIFYRAVDGAFRHGEFFAEDEIAQGPPAAGHRARAGPGGGQRQDPLAGTAGTDRAGLRLAGSTARCSLTA